MTERDGWKASVDGVVSDFDEVTRHLRRRQGQAVRVAWSVVGAATLAMGALIGVNLAPSRGAPTALPFNTSSPSAPQAGTQGTYPNSSIGPLALLPDFATPAPATVAPAPPTPVTAAASGTPHLHRHLAQLTTPVLAAVPVSPPAAPAPVATAPPTASPEPSPPPSSPSPSGGLVDAILASVLHGSG